MHNTTVEDVGDIANYNPHCLGITIIIYLEDTYKTHILSSYTY